MASIYYNSCSSRVAAKFSCCSHFNYLECWKILSLQSKSSFSWAPCKRTETPTKDLKRDLSSSISMFSCRVWTTIFWLSVLEIITTQNTNFWCVRRERKENKLDGTRDELGCEMRCEAGSNIDEREFIRNEQIFLRFSMKIFRENLYSGCRIWLPFSINIVRNVEWRSIKWSQKVDIEIFITKRTLLTPINFL